MSSTVSLYAKGVTVENLHGEELFDLTGEVQVTLNDVDASDFVSEFISSEILDAMEWVDIIKYVAERQLDDADFSGAE